VHKCAIKALGCVLLTKKNIVQIDLQSVGLGAESQQVVESDGSFAFCLPADQV
jgi:hypothetical protein